ncbi:glycosyltransferase [Parapedobacter soli]|uniref:glycosyltransferase n=1 Tax=Parapedobacter soli TaxID=416955 RepID=UPI0021CA5E5D|nr:glycosyltransferase [Parapedobacter soli]
MKNLTVVSSNYPSDRFPARGAFVYNLVQKLCDYYEVTVIAPYKITNFLTANRTNYGVERARVIRPRYVSLGNRKLLGIDFGKLSLYFAKRAVYKILKSLPKPDLIYTHFFSSGLLTEKFVAESSTPLIVASGESSYKSRIVFDKNRIQKFLKLVDFVVCVSETNFDAVEALGYDPRKMKVIPNSVDYELFAPIDKLEARKKLGVSPQKFVVGFIGHFIHRKGVNRVVDAISMLNDPDIALIAVGKGEKARSEVFVKYLEPMPNSQLPGIISAFDIFVLPTLSEGHCNVIEEVKACLVPVVSSKGTSVEKQLNTRTGILLDPMNINEIAENIKLLKDDPTRINNMKKALDDERGSNSLSVRAKKISAVIDKIVGGSSRIQS